MEQRQLLNYIHNNYEIQNWEISGVSVWPLIRLKLFNGLAVEEQLGENVYKDNKWDKLSNAVMLICSALLVFVICLIDYKNDNKVKNEDVAITGYYHLRNFKVPDGRYYNTQIDPVVSLLKKINCRVKVFEHIVKVPFLRKFNKIPRYSKSCLTYFSFLRIKIKYLMYKKGGKYLYAESNCGDEYEQFRRDMINHGIPYEYIWTYRDLCEKVYEINCIKDYYKKKLNVMTCKLGICVVDGINPWSQAFFLACRELGIKTIELQHGIISKDQIAFSNWKCNSMGYANLPDYYFCWDDVSTDIVNNWANCTKLHHAVNTGNIWHEVWNKNIGQGIQEYKKKFGEKVSDIRGKYSKLVLISLQGDRIPMPNYVSEVVYMKSDIFWIIRLHPTTGKKELEKTKEMYSEKDNIYYDEGGEVPLLAWLEIIDLHITCISAVTIEAGWHGIPTISVDTSGVAQRAFADLLQKKCLNIAHNKDELINYLNMDREYMHNNQLSGKKDFCEAIQSLLMN